MGFLDSINQIKNKISYEKVVKVEGVEVSLTLITVEQEYIANSLLQDSSDSEQGLYYFNELRKRILSFSIKKIGGDTIPDVVEYEEEGKTTKKTRDLFVYDFTNNLPNVIIDRLFEAYNDLKDEVEDSIDNKIEVKWYLTPKERDEKRDLEIKEATKLQEKLDAENAKENHNDNSINFREIKVDKEDNKKDAEEESR